MKRMIWTLLTGATLLAVAVAFAQDEEKAPDVKEIVRKTNHVAYYQGNSGRAKVTMKVYADAKNEKDFRTREFTILRRDDPDPKTGKQEETYDGDQEFYVYFERPADVNKTAFMVHKHIKGEDDRWLYLPALDLVNRIASTEKRTSFVGSNFFYEDVSGRNIDLDEHTLEAVTDRYYKLKNVPKDPDSVEFSYYIMWIDKASFIPVQTEYYDKKAERYRVYTAKKVEEIDGFKTVTQSEMSDLRTGGKTTLEYADVKYNIDLPASVFTERYLRRPPRRYLD